MRAAVSGLIWDCSDVHLSGILDPFKTQQERFKLLRRPDIRLSCLMSL